MGRMTCFMLATVWLSNLAAGQPIQNNGAPLEDILSHIDNKTVQDALDIMSQRPDLAVDKLTPEEQSSHCENLLRSVQEDIFYMCKTAGGQQLGTVDFKIPLRQHLETKWLLCPIFRTILHIEYEADRLKRTPIEDLEHVPLFVIRGDGGLIGYVTFTLANDHFFRFRNENNVPVFPSDKILFAFNRFRFIDMRAN